MSRRTRIGGWFLGAAFAAMNCAPAEAPLPTPMAPAPASRWPAFESARTWPQAGPPFESSGHGSGPVRLVETVHVTPDGLEAYRGLVTGGAMPEGAAIAAFHRTSDGRDGSLFAMEKRAGSWVFTAADASGTVLDGDVTLCARCHDEAPADHVFGLPRARAGDNLP